MKYLSIDWLEALNDVLQSSETMKSVAANHSIAVTQLITGSPEGDVLYHLSVRDGSASIGPGAAVDEDVRLEQSYDTAVSVATGHANTQELFVNGSIRIHGNITQLIESEPVFAALDAVFEAVRPQVEYN
jgi:hypothetical protein